MKDDFASELEDWARMGSSCLIRDEYENWLMRLNVFLRAIDLNDVVSVIQDLGGISPTTQWEKYRDRQSTHLKGVALKLRTLAKTNQIASDSPDAPDSAKKKVSDTPSNRIFLVHGHDVAAKESVARFIEKLSLMPLILHEQANEGQTIIEKFESHSNVNFAVVLLTPDDIGASAKSKEALRPRARQNVVLELGYFTGKLGRQRVCALFRPGVEVPSDFHGVLFVELDEPGAWKSKLAQEFVTAGIHINLQGLLG
jgi:predicted nucleotide-binding protein